MKFTLAHEIGHLLLHSQIPLQQKGFEDNANTFKLRSFMERQANRFAAYLLVTPTLLFEHVLTELSLRNIHPKTPWLIYVDNQPCNRQTYSSILYNLATKFKCSQGVIEIWLREYNLVNDARVNTLHHIIFNNSKNGY